MASYNAVVRPDGVYRRPDGMTAMKLYFIDIIGRPDPSRTEWARSGLSGDRFLEALSVTPGAEGIGFIAAFPHITKVFRFSPDNEAVVNVRAWHTPDMADLDLARSEGFLEFACLAEAAIASDEFEIWRAVDSVEAYLAQWSSYKGGAVANPGKLRSYLESVQNS